MGVDVDYRQLGTTDLRVSALGFGTWEIGNPGYGHTDDADAAAAIHRALELGITCVDTAAGYGLGRSEEIVGKALGDRRKDVVLVTKCGLAWDEADPNAPQRRDSSPQRILKEIDDSLRRLGTDWVDLYLVHWPDPNTPIAETAETMAAIVRAGKARYVGVSNYRHGQLQTFNATCPASANQLGYNLFDRRIEEELLPYCREQGIGVMAYGSLCYGLLSGTFTPTTRFTPPDWRASGRAFGLSLFTPEHFAQNLAVVEALKGVATDLGKTLPQLALNWTLNRPGITVGLSGMRKPSEVEDNVGATGWQLAPAELAAIDEILAGAVGNTGPLLD